MKKYIGLLLLIVMCLCGCSNIPPNSVLISPNKDIVDFELISQNDNNAIYRDRTNDVLYYVFCFRSGYKGFFGITPIYGSDGAPVKYAHEAG